MIKILNATISTQHFTLKDFNLSFEPFKFHVILGPSGSGKTLLLETLAGLVNPNKGEIYFNEKRITHLPPEKRGISYLPQDGALFPNMNVFDNIAFGLQIQKNWSKEKIKNTIDDISKKLDIYHLLKRNTFNLSGGEQQRVALARALVLKQPVILLDEPTSSLHETMQEDFCLLLKNIQKEYHITFIMTTHHKDNAFMVADFLHFIENGKIWLSTEPTQLYQQVLPKKIAELMGISNFFTISDNFFCKELNTSFTLSKMINKSNMLYLGVKPENIRVIKDEDIHKEFSNRFVARVDDLLHKENDTIVILSIPETNFKIKMLISTYTLKKLNIHIGKMIHCKIKEEHIFEVY
ncbi:MAG: ABC transporter ATP-binding protein [Bacteroidota bacterium]